MLNTQGQDGAEAPGEGSRPVESQVVREPRPPGRDGEPGTSLRSLPAKPADERPGGGEAVDGQEEERAGVC